MVPEIYGLPANCLWDRYTSFSFRILFLFLLCSRVVAIRSSRSFCIFFGGRMYRRNTNLWDISVCISIAIDLSLSKYTTSMKSLCIRKKSNKMEEAQLRYHRIGNILAGYGIRIHDIEIEDRKTEETLLAWCAIACHCWRRWLATGWHIGNIFGEIGNILEKDRILKIMTACDRLRRLLRRFLRLRLRRLRSLVGRRIKKSS